MKGAEVMEPVRLLLNNLEDSIIQIGYVGENNHIQVQIDCAEVFEKYPAATVSMAVSNPLGQMYPAIIEKENNNVLWTITSSDVSVEGDGKIQLTFINGEEIIKTSTGRTRIKNSIVGNGPAPDPIVDFVTRADAVLAGIPDAIDSALEEAKGSGEFDGPPGYTPQKGVDYTDGQDGVSPTVVVTDIAGGHRVVITDAEGPHSFDVMDGQGGGGSVTVDDELSDTSTNPVQNKVITEEVTSLKEAIASDQLLVKGLTGVPVAVDSLTTFARGSINSQSGAYDSYYQYRVATVDKFTADKTYILSIADGFRVYVFYFTAQGAKISAAWHTGSVTIEKGSIVRIMVARQTESSSEVADVQVFCSKAEYTWQINLDYVSNGLESIDAVRSYGMTWDWWITSCDVDKFGTAYMGYVDTDGYVGIIRRQPDGTMQYKRLAKSYNNDDHNGMAVKVLHDGKILAIGSYGHSENNHIFCFKSESAYSIDVMTDHSFNIPQTGSSTYKTCYSQVFEYNNTLFDFLRCNSVTGGTTKNGYACLVSSDGGETWTAYKCIYGSDPYISFAQATDDAKYLKFVYAVNPASGANQFAGGYIDLSTQKIYDLSGTQIGQFVALAGGSIEDESAASKADLTTLTDQTANSKYGRLFYVARTPKDDTVFLFAQATDSDNDDYIYRVYNGGTIIDIAHSGTAFGNVHYICGACFGKDINTVYYAASVDSNSDGNHELHKVKIESNAVSGDEIITEASMCILRPLFLGNGEVATVVGHYNDPTQSGTFTSWQLKPSFHHA